jgi:hypothetical protein
VTRLVQLVADYGPGELGFAETVQRLALVAPEAQVCATRVAPADTLAAGLCVAQLALADGPRDRLVVHDVQGAPRDPRLWISRTRGGVLVVGADCGWAWSFVAPALCELCALDVPADAEIALAVRHALTNHPHAICAVIGRERIMPPPECALVWTDRAGNLQTTLVAAPAERVTVQIGDCREPARLGGEPAAGELVLAPGTRGLKRLTLGGGSAAERFGHPVAGTPIEITSAARERQPAGRPRASAPGRLRP